MGTEEVLSFAVALLAGFLSIVWWRRRDLQDNPRTRRWRVPAAAFFALVSFGNLALFIAGLAS